MSHATARHSRAGPLRADRVGLPFYGDFRSTLHKPTFSEERRTSQSGQKANYTVTSAGISGLGNVCAVALSHLSTWLTVIARNCCSANYWMESSGNQP